MTAGPWTDWPTVEADPADPIRILVPLWLADRTAAERDQARAWAVALEQRLADVRTVLNLASHSHTSLATGTPYVTGCHVCEAIRLLDAPLDGT